MLDPLLQNPAMWPEDDITTLKKLWTEGHSASVIGNKMGRTRNSIIGKVYRLGMGRGDSPTIIRKIFKHTPETTAKRVKAMKESKRIGSPVMIALANQRPPLKPDQAEVDRIRALPDLPPLVRFVDLAGDQCQWFPHDQSGYNGMCCGRPKQPGISYCERHAVRCFNGVANPNTRPRSIPAYGVGMFAGLREFETT